MPRLDSVMHKSVDHLTPRAPDPGRISNDAGTTNAPRAGAPPEYAHPMPTSERTTPPPQTSWLGPFKRFYAHVNELDVVVRLFLAGCDGVQRNAKALEVLSDALKDKDSKLDPAKLENQRNIATLALDQQRRSYPLLYEHSLISLWGALEVLVEDLAVAWLMGHPDRLQTPPVSEVKLTVGDYERLSTEERLRHIVFEVQRSKKTDLKRGVGQFNALLDAVGLNCAPPRAIQDALFYHHQLRNLVAHRGAVADRRFIEVCPTLGYQVGETVPITEDIYVHLGLSAIHYSDHLSSHCAEQDGYGAAPGLRPNSAVHKFDWSTIRPRADPETSASTSDATSEESEPASSPDGPIP